MIQMILRKVLLLFLVVGHVNSFAPLSGSCRQRETAVSRRFIGVGSAGRSNLQATPDGGVVITGGANGVGFAYAGEFMNRGYDVVICDVKDCSAAASALTKRCPNGGKVYHIRCDVSNSADVERLGQFAVKNLNRIGYWINNAGINGGRRDFRDVPVSQVEAVVKVNLLGILLCTKVAMSILEQQEGFTGHIFNTVGSGVKGGGTPGYACYGATKRGLPQLTASLGMLLCFWSFVVVYGLFPLFLLGMIVIVTYLLFPSFPYGTTIS
jgi:short-subunit dehydrogenase